MKKRRNNISKRKEDKIYFDGKVIETLPGTRFKVRVDRNKGLEPLVIDSQIKTMFKVRNIKIIKGDFVTIEVDPETDIDAEKGITRGVIIQRLNIEKTAVDNNQNNLLNPKDSNQPPVNANLAVEKKI